MTRNLRSDSPSKISRRTFANGLAVAVGATVLGANSTLAQQSGEAPPPTTVTNPPRDFGPGGAPTTYFWDPDIIAVDPSFNNLAQPNTAIKRLYTGVLWAEGPAWSAQGRYLVVERHSKQSADEMVGGRRSRERVPLSVQQLQRQLVRLSGPAALMRASHADGLSATSTTAR